MLGTDTGNAWVYPGYSVHEELRALVGAGLSPHDAIRAGTASAAEALGQSDEFGAVRIGLRADLILVHDDPLADVSVLANPAGVVARGGWFDDQDLEEQLELVASSFGR